MHEGLAVHIDKTRAALGRDAGYRMLQRPFQAAAALPDHPAAGMEVAPAEGSAVEHCSCGRSPQQVLTYFCTIGSSSSPVTCNTVLCGASQDALQLHEGAAASPVCTSAASTIGSMALQALSNTESVVAEHACYTRFCFRRQCCPCLLCCRSPATQKSCLPSCAWSAGPAPACPSHHPPLLRMLPASQVSRDGLHAGWRRHTAAVHLCYNVAGMQESSSHLHANQTVGSSWNTPAALHWQHRAGTVTMHAAVTDKAPCSFATCLAARSAWRHCAYLLSIGCCVPELVPVPACEST